VTCKLDVRQAAAQFPEIEIEATTIDDDLVDDSEIDPTDEGAAS